MESIEKFLNEILSSQDLSPGQESTLQAHKKEITDYLRKEFGNDPVIKYAGSYEKGTIIRDNYDLDIVCYFPSNVQRSLKEIRDDVANHLRKQYSLLSKTSAERITNLKSVSAPPGYHIDVVPGRFIENTKDVFLHLANVDKERLQTNLKTHINHIKNSGCVPVIRLAKIWSNRNNIQIKTFVLELFIVWALNGSRSKNELKISFLKVLEMIKDEFMKIQLVDPANSNNIVSQLVNSSEKAIIMRAAEEAYKKIKSSDNISDWRSLFHENAHETKTVAGGNFRSDGFVPRSPWCNF